MRHRWKACRLDLRAIDHAVLPATFYAFIYCHPGGKYLFASVSILCAVTRRRDEAPIAQFTFSKETP